MQLHNYENAIYIKYKYIIVLLQQIIVITLTFKLPIQYIVCTYV